MRRIIGEVFGLGFVVKLDACGFAFEIMPFGIAPAFGAQAEGAALVYVFAQQQAGPAVAVVELAVGEVTPGRWRVAMQQRQQAGAFEPVRRRCDAQGIEHGGHDVDRFDKPRLDRAACGIGSLARVDQTSTIEASPFKSSDWLSEPPPQNETTLPFLKRRLVLLAFLP